MKKLSEKKPRITKQTYCIVCNKKSKLVLCDSCVAKRSDKKVTKPKLSIKELQELLEKDEDNFIEILPNGEIIQSNSKAPKEKPITMRENLGGEYCLIVTCSKE